MFESEIQAIERCLLKSSKIANGSNSKCNMFSIESLWNIYRSLLLYIEDQDTNEAQRHVDVLLSYCGCCSTSGASIEDLKIFQSGEYFMFQSGDLYKFN